MNLESYTLKTLKAPLKKPKQKNNNNMRKKDKQQQICDTTSK